VDKFKLECVERMKMAPYLLSLFQKLLIAVEDYILRKFNVTVTSDNRFVYP